MRSQRTLSALGDVRPIHFDSTAYFMLGYWPKTTKIHFRPAAAALCQWTKNWMAILGHHAAAAPCAQNLADGNGKILLAEQTASIAGELEVEPRPSAFR